MQEFMGSVRRSLVFKPSGGEDNGGFRDIVEKIGTSVRNSRIGLFSKTPFHALPPIAKPETPRKTVKEEGRVLINKEEAVTLQIEAVEMEENVEQPLPIRWRKGELIGYGAFGRVYMGMNLDSGELLAVKEVAIAVNSASKKTQDQITELEKEVNLLKNLSHPNIVRYLGTAREEDSLNILLEFVPGGSISSLLGKFGSFPESVIRMYTKQLLFGLEYLHQNKIMHRDIKGANILVDNKGCIKLVDFGASKKVVALATMTGAKSMKGTPYWMAPEVIRQTGHSYSADIWSVGCTVIEMATGKPPWSQQYQEEFAALFHVGTTKSHPPIPAHLSIEAKDFLLKCLQKEPDFRLSASDLLKHPFVTGECQRSHHLSHTSLTDSYGKRMTALGIDLKMSMNFQTRMTCSGLKDVSDLGSVRCSSIYPELSGTGSSWQPVNFDDDMCRIDDSDEFGATMKYKSSQLTYDFNQSFNPMCDPDDDWPCKLDGNPEVEETGTRLLTSQVLEPGNKPQASGDCGLIFPSEPSIAEDDDEVTESKIKAFLDEKALDLKKLQTPLYEEFYNSSSVTGPPSPVWTVNKENISDDSNLTPKSRSPNRVANKRLSTAADLEYNSSPGSSSICVGDVNFKASKNVKELPDSQPRPLSPSASFSNRQRKWKEELDEELERKRGLMRQAGTKTSSPKDLVRNRYRDRLSFASPGK
ncbi:mitogen-activated protein kinase kinase kinase NPK1-like isoform X2 [Olea europaea var. sylvestris]|uniref:mitogen-activated protein kinase kinase kinase n=1 Tax=Olea europaea subsp. europaea TaxID=158383 RepID=A0A8S0VHC1_OLEEU|nr:mitogen-activated protein kinase kinase kinase NPK1-like isoform X2 [Olea europaea var. sylvestris]CAA3031481.1 mitogen-activated kinase kinase kinase NPK1 [Olea europaea subsp. europaea]